MKLVGTGQSVTYSVTYWVVQVALGTTCCWQLTFIELILEEQYNYAAGGVDSRNGSRLDLSIRDLRDRSNGTGGGRKSCDGDGLGELHFEFIQRET